VKVVRCSIPYVKDEIPLVLLFRALGFNCDKEILQLICHDLNDKAVMELLRPSFEEVIKNIILKKVYVFYFKIILYIHLLVLL
jgi:DNA-directed RNA polymerase beta subunit